MKRSLIIGVFLVAVISSVIATWYFVGQTNETNALRITDFWMDDHWQNPGGLLLTCKFNFTINNIGIRDLDGLELKVRMVINDVEIDIGNYFEGVPEYGLVSLRAGEIRGFTGTLLYTWKEGGAIHGAGFQPDGASFMAMAMLGDAVLDECRISS